MNKLIGNILSINRYPVKSFAGETLESCMIEPYGMEGDRFCAFYDESKQGWSRYVTARNIPAMLSYQARYANGDIRVSAPDGRTFGWDEHLLEEIQSLSRVPVTMSELKSAHPDTALPQLLSVDGASILLVTDGSLRKLETMWGKPLDARRFRANFIVGLNDDSFFEGDWIGRELSIGDVRLKVDSFCERCIMIATDPDHQKRDPSLLKIVNQKLNLRFGVYASVIKTGEIRLQDPVELV